MKKLSLLLLTIFVSAIGWTQNPYAYGLSSKLSDDKQNLTINYSLNVKATSVQLEIVDENGNTCYTKQGAPVNKGANSITISTASLPREKALNWKVIVNGGNTGTQPTVPVWAVSERPNSVHGVAVNNDQQSANFGKIYAAESMMTNATNAKWTWLNGNVPALLEYNQDLSFKAFHKKSKQNGTAVSNFSTTEPNRVRVSADGRIFVASYHSNSSTAVWEYTGSGNYNTIIPRTAGSNLRPTSIDVKGSGKDLKLLVTYYDNKVDETNMIAKVYCYEYPIGTSTSQYTAAGTLKAQYNDHKTNPTLPGLLYQAVKNGWSVYTVGMINAVYGENDMIWMKIDFYVNKNIPSKVIAFNSSKTTPLKENNLPLSTDYYYGGDGIVVKGNLLVTGNNCAMHFYQTNTNGSITKKYNDLSTINNNTIYTNIWINDLAIDHANNLYVVSAYEGNMMVVALPNGGKTITNAAKQYAFTVSDPVPNILATDLRCEPHATQNKYIFSFNTNTKPEEAQIRFYDSYEDMQKSLNVVNADNYNGTNANKPAFVYNIPDDKLKQGRIEVELGGVCGKLDANNVIINDSLPAGVLYWSVYVKTRESSAFAPIYEQSTTGDDTHQRLHATVNNYPETDGFGHIYAVNYYAEFDARNGLMEYSFNPNGNSIDDQNNIKNSNRYKLVKNYLNPSGNKPKFTNQRRLAVAPDGKVYIADCGQSYPFDANADRPWMFKGGGVFVWNPNTQTGNEIQISLFSTKDQYSTATAVDIYNRNGQLKLYATNTYGEFDNHYNKGNLWKGKEYTEANQADVNIYGWNGFKEFNLGTPNNILLEETTGTVLHSLGMGDGNGHISLVAMEKGVWMAQNRLNDVQYTIDVFKANNSKKPALPDNTENYVLSFVPYDSNTRTWRSCTTKGINYSGSSYTQNDASELTQLTSSPLQACPGAGLAYRKTNGKEYLYIVNHQGNIVELQITSWSGTTPTVKYIKTYPGSGPKGTNDGGRTDGAISSMCFDYAGNLVTTSGADYLGSASQNILVYTMPYDRVNAREIQAPNSCRMIPERVAHLDMGARELDLVIQGHQGHAGCAIDLYRPLQGAMFNTICLPFELNLGSLPADHPLKNAKLQAYTELKLETVGGEKMLELVFTDVNDNIIRANTPYIIRPENDEGINHIIRFDGPLVLTSTTGNAVQKTEAGGTYSITYQGVIPYQYVEPKKLNGESLTLMLVSDNRLALMTSAGNMLGFRGYFQLNQPLPKGMRTRITTSKGTVTNTTIVVDGKKVNVEKFLRDGRVYIRVGDSLYTITGEKVE